jgi:hypothetical protein
MITFLTICSANYLAHAKTLGESLLMHNPGRRFVIGLVDRLPAGAAPSMCQPHEVIPVEELDIPGFYDMATRYDVVELNTAVKPFYIEHLYHRDSAVDAVVYLDPDILVCGSFEGLEERLQKNSIVVTPHSCTHDDSPTNIYYEGAMLGTGVYNLGFIGTSRSETTTAFLHWWQKRLRDHCYYWPGRGLFVDQLWVNLAPLYFSGVLVEKSPGYNMCYWNHFERRLSVWDGRYWVNEKHSLIFYHFSSFDPNNPTSITKRVSQRVCTFEERPDLKPIYDYYRSRLLANDYEQVRLLPYQLRFQPPPQKITVRGLVAKTMASGLRALPRPLQRRVGRLAALATAAVESS